MKGIIESPPPPPHAHNAIIKDLERRRMSTPWLVVSYWDWSFNVSGLKTLWSNWKSLCICWLTAWQTSSAVLQFWIPRHCRLLVQRSHHRRPLWHLSSGHSLWRGNDTYSVSSVKIHLSYLRNIQELLTTHPEVFSVSLSGNSGNNPKSCFHNGRLQTLVNVTEEIGKYRMCHCHVRHCQSAPPGQTWWITM